MKIIIIGLNFVDSLNEKVRTCEFTVSRTEEKGWKLDYDIYMNRVNGFNGIFLEMLN